jgi:hypothetical protein
MKPALDDDALLINTLLANYLIHQAMFAGDPSGPIPFKTMLQGFGLPDSPEWMLPDGGEKRLDFLDGFVVRLDPILEVLPAMWGETNDH